MTTISGPIERAHSARAVALETAKLALINDNRAIGLLHDGAGCDLSSVHIQANHAFVDGASFSKMARSFLRHIRVASLEKLKLRNFKVIDEMKPVRFQWKNFDFQMT